MARWSSGNAFVCRAGDLRFKSLAGQIKNGVVNDLTLLQYFFKCCVARVQWCGDGPLQTRYTLLRVTASIIKDLIYIIFSFDYFC